MAHTSASHRITSLKYLRFIIQSVALKRMGHRIWQWSSWCTGVYATRADLPILPRSTLSTLASRKEDAVTEAKKNIDRFLSRLK